MNRTSIVWNHFTDIGNKMAYCNICKEKYSFKSSISNLKKHYQSQHANVSGSKKDSRSLDTTEDTLGGTESIASDFGEENIEATTSAAATTTDKPTEQTATPQPPTITGLKRKATFQFPRTYTKRMAFQPKKIPSRLTAPSSAGGDDWRKPGVPLSNRIIKDDSQAYGDYIASKHRKYSEYTKSIIEHLIADILYKADMGRYEADASSENDGAAASSNGDAALDTVMPYLDANFVKEELRDPLTETNAELL